MTPWTREATEGRGLDAVLCLAILSFTTVYISLWPRDLTAFDEGLFLYEAKRILEGQVIYRDFFEIITPVSFYVMALVFKLFGISMETARISMSVLHAMIAVAMYVICRTCGIRRSFAGLAAITHPAVFYPALSIASAHWVGTFVILLAVWLALRRSSSSPRSAFWLGMVLGLLISVQQQKGVILGMGGAILVLADAWLLASAGASALFTLVAYAAGGAALLVPLLLALLWFAGFESVYSALVYFPFVFYPQFHRHISWGYYVTFAPQLYVFPRLIKYLPAAIPLAACMLAGRWWRDRELRSVRPVFVVTLFAAFTILSIAYNADYTHLAVTAPVWFLVVAQIVEALCRWLEQREGLFRYAGASVCLVVCLVLGFRLLRNPEVRRGFFPYPHETAFGRVDFMDRDEIALVDTLHRLLEDAPSREIFCFPACASLYLLVDASNPTPYQLLLQNYSDPQHWTKTIEILERNKVPFVSLTLPWVKPRQDPVARYLAERYQRVWFTPKTRFSAFVLYRRMAEPSATRLLPSDIG